ncbi:DNA adenine methylase [Gimesia aquarii]|uniref:Site-specific DNA-methyltransferase (adenine-specific) n=1 Tax=Gimesia aquarii TaxID=2527964 RepID=A0A517W2V5_9PLAN|nr:Dam family site-specific DNA-(adenine-N6)-methyltransferase [Gimesia aquarii]QDT99560.1 Modification methylase DpnIIA [Gimesia aquarii]
MTVNQSNHVESFLRWAGSKRQLIPHLAQAAPPHFERYVEPFAGSACFFFYLRPKKAVLSDFNEHLIQSYLAVKKHPIKLARSLTLFGTQVEDYYEIRRIFGDSSVMLERAAQFIYLNSYCFNGVYRTNLRGKFNVPRGSKTRGVPNETNLRRCSIVLRNANVYCQDYKKTLRSCTDTDFIYLDPPYTKLGARYRGEYGVGSFTSQDEQDLVSELRKLDQIGSHFLLSYRASAAFIRLLDPNWHIQRIRVRRNVAGFSDARRTAIEILVRNYDSCESLKRTNL